METKSALTRVPKLAVFITLFVALACMLAAGPAPAFADGSSSAASKPASAEPASNMLSKLDGNIDAYVDRIASLPIMRTNNIRLGNNLDISNEEASNSLIAIARQSSVKGTTAKGNLLVAGADVAIEESSADQAILTLGQTLAINNTTAKAIAAVGNVVSVSGTYNSLVVYADTAYIDGTVNGDIAVDADNVEIGPNARIEGTLYVSRSKEPVVSEDAEVSDIQVVNSVDDYIMAVISPMISEFVTGLLINLAILSFFGALIIALLAEWLLPRQTAGAVEMVRKRKRATIGSGAIGAIAIPLLVILLAFLGITLPVAQGVTFAALSLSTAATGFMGASVFRLVFKNMGRFKSALAGGVIMGAASAIPLFGIVVQIVAFIYLLGYVLQSIYLNMRHPSPASEASEEKQAEASEESSAEEGEAKPAEAGEEKQAGEDDPNSAEAGEANSAEADEGKPAEEGDPSSAEVDKANSVGEGDPNSAEAGEEKPAEAVKAESE